MFDNIDVKVNRAPKQEKKGDIVTKKKRGRPQKPHLQRYEIKLDTVLRRKLEKYAKDNFGTMSGTINLALREFFNKK